MVKKPRQIDEINVDLVEKLKKTRLYESLPPKSKGRYMDLLSQIYFDTAGELTDTEYENLVALSFVCDEFEVYFMNVGFDNVDPRTLGEYRHAKETILSTMHKNREGRLASKETINEAKDILKELRKTGALAGDIIDLEDADGNKTDGTTTVIKNKRSARKVVDSGTGKKST